MKMETIDDGFRHIEQGVNSTNDVIRHFKKVEKALKVQEETIAALKAKLAIYQSSKDKISISLSNKNNTTMEAIKNLQRETNNDRYQKSNQDTKTKKA
ncbi:hypothetical protein MFLAVUS_000951 [Mucor flavus]|uniref:Uncharacterized protein n=1 Tax=Mucor flavus TaxID=439312 RepID=A0ABP9YL51_9FUNG